MNEFVKQFLDGLCFNIKLDCLLIMNPMKCGEKEEVEQVELGNYY